MRRQPYATRSLSSVTTAGRVQSRAAMRSEAVALPCALSQAGRAACMAGVQQGRREAGQGHVRQPLARGTGRRVGGCVQRAGRPRATALPAAVAGAHQPPRRPRAPGGRTGRRAGRLPRRAPPHAQCAAPCTAQHGTAQHSAARHGRVTKVGGRRFGPMHACVKRARVHCTPLLGVARGVQPWAAAQRTAAAGSARAPSLGWRARTASARFAPRPRGPAQEAARRSERRVPNPLACVSACHLLRKQAAHTVPAPSPQPPPTHLLPQALRPLARLLPPLPPARVGCGLGRQAPPVKH